LGIESANITLCIQIIKMLKNTGEPMDALELAEKAKYQNIIDMAVGFTATLPLFQERSADLIKEKQSGVPTRMMSGIASQIVEISSTLKICDKSDKSKPNGVFIRKGGA